MNKHSNVVFSFFLLSVLLLDQTLSATGSIRGKVLDAETKSPLAGVNIVIVGTQRGAATDLEGNYLIPDVLVGNYTLEFSYVGYKSALKSDIIVKSKRVLVMNVELLISPVENESVTVTAGYFSKSSEQTTSSIDFSYEEIRRAPGSGGDVSRIMMSLPSIAKVNDQSNNLIVRGGNPIENTFFIDNIEIPNINHFPDQASSGGPIGMVNVDFIQDVRFYTGGFSVVYGDRLSSIMDITFREGNRSEFDGQLDLNFAGFGGVVEGPFFSKKGSWLFSARRSYLDFVVKAFDVGSSIAPSYGDYQGKLVYDINSHHKLIFLGVFGDDHNRPDRHTAEENDMLHYGNQDIYEGTGGLNWRAIWGRMGYSNTSLAYTYSKFKEDFYETSTATHMVKNRSFEQSFKLRHMNHLRLHSNHSLEFGVDIKYLINNYKNFYNTETNILGDSVQPIILRDEVYAQKYGISMNYILKPVVQFTIIIGLRSDYFSYNKNVIFSPRFSLSYKVTPTTSLNGSVGIFYQNLPILFLAQSKQSDRLKDPRAIHYVVGIEHLLTESTQFTLELYQKEYDHFPLDPKQPALFPLDKSRFYSYEKLVDKGKARSRGIEIVLQKKLDQDFYGLVCAAYFRTQYQGLDDLWRDRDYDNRFTFSIEGGYKPNREWEFSLRWIYAGGRPYTPLDIAASMLQHRDVLDANRINQSRYPEYHSMNIRFDRRFNFSSTNLILYLSAWNAYNRKNIATYFWNDKEQRQDEIYQWQILPIFGIEYEF